MFGLELDNRAMVVQNNRQHHPTAALDKKINHNIML